MIIEGFTFVLFVPCILETVVMFLESKDFRRDIVAACYRAENLLMLHNCMASAGFNPPLVVEYNQIKQIFDGGVLPGDIWIVTADYKCVFKTDGAPYIFLFGTVLRMMNLCIQRFIEKID